MRPVRYNVAASVDTVLLGPKSFELVRGGGGPPWGPHMRVYVFSRTLKPEAYPEVRVTGTNAAEVVAALRAESGRGEIWLFGGGELFSRLLAAGQVDTVEVTVVPVLLARRGLPLALSRARGGLGARLDRSPRAQRLRRGRAGLRVPDARHSGLAKGRSIWTVLQHDPAAGTVEMLKVTPGFLVVRLTIVLRPRKGSGCDATVTYCYTALGPDGEAYVGKRTVAAYAEFMRGWENALNAYLRAGRGNVTAEAAT